MDLNEKNLAQAKATADWLGISLSEFLARKSEQPKEKHVRLGYSDPTAAAAVGNVTRERGY